MTVGAPDAPSGRKASVLLNEGRVLLDRALVRLISRP